MPVAYFPTSQPSPTMVRAVRWQAAGAGLGLMLLMIVASQLTPDPRGYGTHQQLGLGECSFFRAWQIGCPSCGMTTAWSHLMRGEIGAAAGANVAGLVLGILALLAIPWLLASSLRGRWCYLRPSLGLLLPLLAVVLAVACFDWIYRWGWPLAIDRWGSID